MFLRLWYYPILKKHFLSCKSLKRNDLMRAFWAGPFLRTPSTKEDAWRRIGHFFSSLENLKNLNSNFALACLCVKNENGFFFSAKIKNHRWKTSSARRLQKEVCEWRDCWFWIRKNFFDFSTHETKVGFFIQLNKEL